MGFLDIERFRAIPLNRDPFEYVVVPGFVDKQACAAINADYPEIESPGSLPLSQVSYGPAFGKLVEELEGPAFREAIEEKFGVDLRDRPTTITVRGRCSPRDGRIHTDSVTKIMTILIYMNASWEEGGGRLRLLRGPNDLEDYVAEVPPQEGTMIVFRRSDNSYHGHKPFSGPRRVVQFNWVTGSGSRRMAMMRHWLSARLKRMLRGPKSRAGATADNA